MKTIHPFLLPTVASLLLAAGCASDKHTMTTAQPGQVSVCSKCYDQVRTVQDRQGRRFGPTVTRTITTHMCEDCKNEMTIYAVDGVLKVRCPTCAPEGVDCDRCVPKEAKK